jgi:hypothetical protein
LPASLELPQPSTAGEVIRNRFLILAEGSTQGARA